MLSHSVSIYILYELIYFIDEGGFPPNVSTEANRMSGHPLYARWRILERAVETVALASAAGDAELETLARELALTAAERLEVPTELVERMENDHAEALCNPTKRSCEVFSLARAPGRVSS